MNKSVLFFLVSINAFAIEGIPGEFTFFTGPELRSNFFFDGQVNGQGYIASFKFNQPVVSFGGSYNYEVKKFENGNTLNPGIRLIKSFSQSTMTETETYNGSTTTFPAYATLDSTSILVTAELRMPRSNNYTLIASPLIGMDIISFTTSPVVTTPSNGFVWGVCYGIKKDNYRLDFSTKLTNGTVNAYGVGKYKGLSFSGDYSYATYSLSFGYAF